MHGTRRPNGPRVAFRPVSTDADGYPQLAGVLRRLLDVTVDLGSVDPELLERATSMLEHASHQLEAVRDGLSTEDRAISFDGQRLVMPHWHYETRGDALVARGEFSHGHTGPPRTVHGGWIAFAFDEIFGWANVQAGYPSMTGKLTVRYRSPTPVGAPLEFRVPRPRVEGKRVHVQGTLTVDGAVTAEADGLFVQPRRGSFNQER